MENIQEKFQKNLSETFLLRNHLKEPDEMIRDRIVLGRNSRKIREKLINEGKDLALDKAIDIA